MTSRILLTCLALGSSASAAVITQTQNFSFVPSSFQNLTFSQFNPSLGTLNGITVSVSLNKSGGSVSADNDSPTVASVDFNSEVFGNISSSSVQLKTASGAKIFGSNTGDLDVFDTISMTLAASIGDATSQFNNTGGADYYRYYGDTGHASSSGNIGSSYWAAYQGAGSYTIKMNATNVSGISAQSGVQYAVVAPSVFGSVTVAYNYTSLAPVPEPSSALLLVPASLLLARRKRLTA